MSRRLFGLLAVLGLLLAGCVSPGERSVSINSRNADLVFGVEEDGNAAPTPAQAELRSLGAAPPDPFSSLNSRRRSLFAFLTPPFEEVDCPKASPEATPAKTTEPNVGENDFPQEGVYRWNGVLREINAAGQVVEQKEVVTKRMLRRFEPMTDTRFRYQIVQPFGEHFLVSTFEVNTAAQSQRQPAGEGVVQAPKARDPEGGLVLKSTEVYDLNGDPAAEYAPFRPATGVLYLPLPVTSGENFASSAVDPTTGTSVFHQATVYARSRIDACGEVVDGWTVEATQTITTSSGQDTIRYDYVVATQYGAIVIAEAFGRGNAPNSAEFTIAQVVPDPLPPGIQ